MKTYSYIVILLLLLSLSACDNEDNNSDDYPTFSPVEQKKSTKRGVAFNFQFVEDISVLGDAVSWSYNWGHSQNEIYDDSVKSYGIDFCPMAWNSIDINLLSAHVTRYPECQYLLAYNEPNLVDQANMTPQEAADGWGELKSAAEAMDLKIISPAMNYGTLENYYDPIKWLDEFFALVPLSDVEGIAVHCYMGNVPSLKVFVERFEKYGKPIWLTEFCAWEDWVTLEKQKQYMSDALNYLESNPIIERYAWFIPRGNGSEDNFPYMFMLKNAYPVELTELGMIYTQMSTQDKSIYYPEAQKIEAEHYSSISIAESAEKPGWTNGPRVQQTTDAPNESLELYNFLSNHWVEYQIEPSSDKIFDFSLRYACFIDTEIDVYVDDELVSSITLINTGYNFVWNTASFPLPLEEGKQTLRLRLKKGTCHINWFQFS